MQLGMIGLGRMGRQYGATADQGPSSVPHATAIRPPTKFLLRRRLPGLNRW
jgi:hypothetical protein